MKTTRDQTSHTIRPPSPPHRPLLLPSSLPPLSPSLPCKPSPPHLQSCLTPSLLRHDCHSRCFTPALTHHRMQFSRHRPTLIRIRRHHLSPNIISSLRLSLARHRQYSTARCHLSSLIASRLRCCCTRPIHRGIRIASQFCYLSFHHRRLCPVRCLSLARRITSIARCHHCPNVSCRRPSSSVICRRRLSSVRRPLGFILNLSRCHA
ncbi:hypothetical protein F5148DRAFT_302852 [Russula earlei]|uniref:Uncharacterized protein n=1 Tax=Russula earlei TaxID=71964 RepID=A0ACC0UKM2_9AGAM|nr:hypothetical protein F5148DRAFT_302852 [Russula earlei]